MTENSYIKPGNTVYVKQTLKIKIAKWILLKHPNSFNVLIVDKGFTLTCYQLTANPYRQLHCLKQSQHMN